MKEEKNNSNKEKILLGLEKVYKDLVEIKRKMNKELAVLKDGKVVRIKP